MTDPALLEIADSLYAGPLSEFTATRDSLSKGLIRDSGNRELAAKVKALKKPSMAAWVVNLLVRAEADQVTEILTVAEGLRAAQTAMDGDQLRALTRQRRQLTAAVTTRARALASEHGVRVTEPVAGQIEATLTAALLDADAAAVLRTGLLVAAMEPTGFAETSPLTVLALPEVLGFVPVVRSSDPIPAQRPDLHVVPDPDAKAKARQAQKEALETALAATQESVRSARANYKAAHAEVTALQARTLQRQAEIDELNRRLAQAESEQEQLDGELVEAEEVAAEAEIAVDVAETARDRAAHALGGS